MFHKLSPKWIFLMSLAMVMLAYGAGVLFGPMTYEVNDDVTIDMMLSLFTFAGLWWVYPWVSIPVLYPVGILYQFLPQFPWWYLTCHAFVAGSMMVMHYFGLRLAQIKKLPLWLVLFLFAILDSVFCFFPITEVTFSTVPAVIGGGMIALVMFYPYASIGQRRCILGAVLLGTVLAISFRWEPGTVMSAFLLLNIAWVYARMHGLFSRKMLRRTMAAVCVIGGICVGIHLLNTYINLQAQGVDWVKDNPARTAYMDYAHDEFEDNPELYAAVGWTEDTYQFAQNWIFLSDEITAESFQYVADHSVTNPANRSLIQNLNQTVEKVIRDWRMLLWLGLMLALLGMSTVLALIKKDWLALLVLGLNLLACLVIFGYLSVSLGRILPRSVFVVIYPSALLAVFVLLESYHRPVSRKLSRVINLGVVALCGIWLLGLYLYAPTQSLRVIYYQSMAQNQADVEKYEYDHPDQTFFHYPYESITYPQKKQRFNASTLGGCAMWHSEYIRQFQKKNDIEILNWTVFQLPHVYYLGSMDSHTANVTEYLQKEFDCRGIAVLEPVAEDSDIYCMKFVYEDNEADFANYYTVVEGEYLEVTK